MKCKYIIISADVVVVIIVVIVTIAVIVVAVIISPVPHYDNKHYRCLKIKSSSSFDRVGFLASSHSELLWNYESYIQMVGLLGRRDHPVARSLLTQENTKAEKQADIQNVLKVVSLRLTSRSREN
jgi:hypothetical protein